MHAAIPVISPSDGFSALPAFEWENSAVSHEAGEIRKAARAVISEGERSQALFAGKAALISELVALEAECGEEDWDGHGARPIDFLAVEQVKRFLRTLPDRIPLPEISVEPDGSLSLDWIHSQSRLFSVSVTGRNRLAYAWLDGTDSGHAVARFDGQSIPLRILQGIEAAVGARDATIRSA